VGRYGAFRKQKRERGEEAYPLSFKWWKCALFDEWEEVKGGGVASGNATIRLYNKIGLIKLIMREGD